MITSIIIFLIVLAVLIFVHELGHFIVAKLFGIRVDEFALGFPPKLFSFKYGETVYAINLIPFGGYVKIFGENPDDESISGEDSKRSMVNKSKWIQAAVLVAGITFNIIFAFLIFTGSLMSGLTAPVGYLGSVNVTDPHVVITGVLPGSPAEMAGLAAGERIDSASTETATLSGQDLTVPALQDLIANSDGKDITINYEKDGTPASTHMMARGGVVAEKVAVGISMDMVGTLKANPIEAIVDGAKITGTVVGQTAAGLFIFIKNAVIGQGDFSQVAGPVGIVGYVGQAYSLGILYLLAFTSLISVNLALINLLPFPALDGGRLFFILIEAIKGSPIKPKVANTANAIGFALLILLMIVVTYHDIAKFFVK